MSNVAADGADIGALQLQARQVPQLVEPQRAVDGELVLVDLAKFGLLAVELVLDIPHDFLEHIFQGHHADGAAIFIDDDGEMGVAGKKEVQQFLQRHHFRHGNQLALDPEQIGLRIAHHRHQFLDVNEADRVIEMAAAKRKTGVARFKSLLQILLKTLLEIEKHDLAAWRHDIAHHALPEIERVDEQIAPELRDLIGFFAFIQDEAQFLFAVGQLRTGDRFDAEQFLQKEIRRFI
jgi:hypothetical protein